MDVAWTEEERHESEERRERFNELCMRQDELISKDDEASLFQQLSEGQRLMLAKHWNEAIKLFVKVARTYESAFDATKCRYFCARNQVETTLYLLNAFVEHTHEAQVVSANWCYAYYFNAYALIEQGQLAAAKPLLQKALALAPHNSEFLSELGHIQQLERDWSAAEKTFSLAEAAATGNSPEDVKKKELSRSWRGLGYVYVEQDRLADAEKIYRRCLELDPNDNVAADELRGVESERAKRVGKQSRP